MRCGVGDAAPRRHNRGNRVGVEFSGDWQAEAFLETDERGLELRIEGVCEIRRRFGEGEVTEAVEVFFQFRHAADVATSLCV